MNEKVLFLLSGGMDSTTLAYWLHDEMDFELYPVYVMYKSNHMINEICSVTKIVNKMKNEKKRIQDPIYIPFNLREIYEAADPNYKIPLLRDSKSIPNAKDKKQRSTVIPFRNSLMLLLLAGIGEIKGIYTLAHGAVREDYASYKDCRGQFFTSIEETINLGCTEESTSFEILRPFISKTKSELVKFGIKHKVPYELTTTCYRGEKTACGKCDACIERLQAFKEAGIKDPITYK